MIVITGATGRIGGQVLAHLLGGTEPLRVIARDPSRLPLEARRSVEVVQGSHGDAEVVTRAFAGARAVFWLPPGGTTAESAEAAYLDFSRPACAAFKACGVRQVVGISALGRGWPKPAGHVTASLQMDDAIAATGVAYRALACASLMENVLRQTASIRATGDFTWPTPADVKSRHVATRDVATVAARLLRDPSWGDTATVPLIGPEDLTFAEMMSLASDALGKPVRYHEMSMADLSGAMLARGASHSMTQAMVEMMTAKNEGLDDTVERTSATSADTPTAFRDWCEAVLKPAVQA